MNAETLARLIRENDGWVNDGSIHLAAAILASPEWKAMQAAIWEAGADAGGLNARGEDERNPYDPEWRSDGPEWKP